MPLITRTQKGSALTYEEMDGNLTFLESNISNTSGDLGELTDTVNELIVTVDKKSEFAYKYGPLSFVSTYKNRWNSGYNSGPSMDATSSTDGIFINETGIYEMKGWQRSTGADAFVGLAVNGDRLALENKTESIWAHDHSAALNMWSKTLFLGALNSGELITLGPPATTTSLAYSINGYTGGFYIKRIA